MVEEKKEKTSGKVESKPEKAASLETKPVDKKVEEKKEEKKIEKTKEPSKKSAHEEDFKYIVRIADTDLDGEKKVIHALTGIKGIGLHLACFIADKAGVDRHEKIGNLSDDQIENIKSVVNNLSSMLPSWMSNHRNEYYGGSNFHLFGSDLLMRIREDINILKKIRSYRGIRHELGLPVRGQRTRSNNRKGLSVGVSRKARRAESSSKKSEK
jgi:small subunit ribosomal protein S13